ncbi:hypothetical protein D3875_21865 [Deinococcus cavernae]|uniref:Uncharacterized protein n=1 Tax=Deinococcus cavernae TaxID=2320857 RepID=A0A418UZU0_9DEIO|nr:hypothetical protein D3875_21865 [Deinococcus cavernae]
MFTPEALGASVFTLAALVAFIVQFVKKQLERQGRKLRWYVTLLIALGVSEGLSALLYYAGYGARFGSAPPPWTWLIFGLVAAAAGAGGRDLLMSFAERSKTDVVVRPPEAAPVPTAPINPNTTIVIERPASLDDAPLDTGR